MTVETRKSYHSSWNDQRKSSLLADIVNRRISLDEACRRHSLAADELEEWLRSFRRSALAQFDATLKRTLIDQGANADALTAGEFTGTLDDISIADLIQTVQIARKDAVITVTRDGSESRLWCAAGAVVDAESGPLTGEAAVYRMLSFDAGDMIADLRPVLRERCIHTSTQRLLLEAARRKDECDKLCGTLGDLARHYRWTEIPGLAMSDAERGLAMAFDVARSVREVALASELGDLETLTALANLIAKGHLTDAGLASQPPEVAPNSFARANPEPLLSFMPLIASQHAERNTTFRWLTGSVGAAVLVSAAYWLGARAYDLYSPAPPASTTSAAPAAPPLQRYAVTTRVEPPEAEIWLDGSRVAVGHLATSLLENGAKHELRIVAEGFIPASILFIDAAPPSEIQLEKLPAISSAEASAETSAPPGVEAKVVTAPKTRALAQRTKAASATRGTDRRVASKPEVDTARKLDAPRESVAASTPRVQMIE